jgi:hypothetical protein
MTNSLKPAKKDISASLIKVAMLCLLFALTLNAQATRTWVSGVGDDANPCSRTAPCKTFQGAISKTAPAGEINCLDPGGFGAVTITKAITIDCGGTFGSVLVSGTNGIVVSAGSTDVVTLRSLDIQGLGTGISGVSVLAANTVLIEDLRVENFTTSCINVNASSNVQLIVRNSTLQQCGSDAISTFGSGAAVVTSVVADTRMLNSVHGYNAQNGSHVSIRNSTIFANSVGVIQTNGFSTVSVFESLLVSNATALQSVSPAVMFAFGNSFFGNNLVFNPNGGAIGTGGDNSATLNGANGIANAGTTTKI